MLFQENMSFRMNKKQTNKQNKWLQRSKLSVAFTNTKTLMHGFPLETTFSRVFFNCKNKTCEQVVIIHLLSWIIMIDSFLCKNCPMFFLCDPNVLQ